MTGYRLYRADGSLSPWVTDLYLSPSGWPWGMGADRLTDTTPDWSCDDCGKPARKSAKAVYPDRERCIPCAREWIEATFTAIPVRPAPWAQHEHEGQQTLELEAA